LVERQEFIVAEVYSWLSPQAKPFSIEDAQILLNSFVWSTVQLARHEPVYLHVAQSLPPAAAAELSHLHTHNLQSLYLMPLVAQNLLIGVLIFENISTAETVFTETRRLLEVAAGILSSALAHQQLLRELEQKINLRTRELAALYDLAILGSRSASLSDVLLPMLSRILEITASDAVCLHSLTEDGLRLVVHLGMNADQLAQHEHIPLTPKLKRWFYAKNGSTVDPGRTKSQPTPAAFALPDFPQLRLIRLQVHERVLGLLCCYRRSSVPYNPHEISTLATIGEQLGVIIENYRLRLEAEAFAGLRERQRLARELHDSVSQSLYSVTLFARAGQDALEADDLQKLTQTLGEVESNAKSALRAMRLLLYELRTEEISGGLKRALIERFHMVENRLGVRTELDIDDTLYLEPKAEREMFWLVTEALNNVVKHAEAQHVFVSLRRTPAGMELAIVDDGLGFDLHQAPAGIGLSSMRERASLLGGALEVRSQPGAGTQVRMEIPFDLASRGD
jgi:signal transduction histidine kinase